MSFKETFARFAAFKAYMPVVAFASTGIGICVGVLADKFIFSDEEEEDDYEKDPNAFLDYIDEDGVRHVHYDLDDEEVREAIGMEVYDDLDIPKGVNMIEDVASNLTDKASKLFVKPDLNKYIDYTKYQDMAKNYSTDIPKEDAVEEFIHVIDEDEFVKETGNEDGYISVTASYFTQEKILAGWNDELVEREPSETVGEKSLERFDDPSVKAVYVRNDNLKVLYEIVRCDDTYESAVMEAAMEPSPEDMS